MFISNAYAQTGAADSGLSSIIMMIGMFAVLYFIMIRPQMKRQFLDWVLKSFGFLK